MKNRTIVLEISGLESLWKRIILIVTQHSYNFLVNNPSKNNNGQYQKFPVSFLKFFNADFFSEAVNFGWSLE